MLTGEMKSDCRYLWQENLLSAGWSITLPAPIDDQFLREDGAGRQPPGVPSLFDYLAHSVKVFEFADQVASRSDKDMPSPRQSSSRGFRQLVDILEFNRQLDGMHDAA